MLLAPVPTILCIDVFVCQTGSQLDPYQLRDPAFILSTAPNYFISEENIQALTVSMHRTVDKGIDFAQKKNHTNLFIHSCCISF